MSETRIVAVAGLGSPAATLQTNSFDTNNDLLLIFVNVTSLSVSGVPIIQFNFDTGITNYSFSVSDNFATPITGISGAATGIQFGAINSTNAFGAQITVGNGPSQAHELFFNGLTGVISASSAPHIITGAGIWASTSQINSIQVSSPQGGNLGAGSGILVIAYVP